MTAHRETKRELEQVGADTHRGDTEGTTGEDRWFGGGEPRLVRPPGGPPAGNSLVALSGGRRQAPG